MIQRLLACGQALPQPTDMWLGEWSRRLGEEEKMDGRLHQAVKAERQSKYLLLRQLWPSARLWPNRKSPKRVGSPRLETQHSLAV